MTVEFAFGDYGDRSKGLLATGLKWLGGESVEMVLPGAEPAGTSDGIFLWRSANEVAGYARVPVNDNLETATGLIYGSLLKASRGMNIYRIWNIVPHINGRAAGGLENYHAFCRGRAVAFESELGSGFSKNLPAASAIGTNSPDLTITFLAGIGPTRHYENPAQMPAYQYPPEHGPRSPSFARGTVVSAGGRISGFISGTSAIVGHATVAPHDTHRQLSSTFENLRLISTACGLGPNFGNGTGCERHFKVYLRRAVDLTWVEPQVKTGILVPGDRVTYLEADICRSDLNVEIELTIRGADST